eukprot:355719-Pleurochrysis_carterae.AAC.1
MREQLVQRLEQTNLEKEAVLEKLAAAQKQARRRTLLTYPTVRAGLTCARAHAHARVHVRPPAGSLTKWPPWLPTSPRTYSYPPTSTPNALVYGQLT